MMNIMGDLRKIIDDEIEDAVADLKAELAASRARCAAAELIIQRGVALMTSDQVGQWEGVRAWLEQDESAYREEE